GIEFVMTAMFVVIFLEQWRKEKSHESGVLGLGISLLCLLVFGRDHFIIPSMVGILVVLSGMRIYTRQREKGREEVV
ncbi:MAG: branched-chain amino acid transporter AzlC, partial [Suipraeoptans intestinalis]|nr:branched-chain amino acid transporter AzlC [Suipraeoptans intestinalis]